jgi:ribosomal protein S18 acetylase RimI-like enzyme
MELTIRNASREDEAIIADFNARLAQETEHRTLDSAVLLSGVRSLLSDPIKGRYVVAEHAGRVVGQVMITYEWSDWRNGWFWWIQSVYVEEAFRGKGVFKCLYKHVTELSQSDGGVCGLRLYVESNNSTAIATYKALGMKKPGYEMFESIFNRETRP